MRCELRINLGEGLTKQTLPQILFVGRRHSGRRNTTPRCRRSSLPAAVLIRKASRRSSVRRIRVSASTRNRPPVRIS